jgi:hypothetical protein
MKEFRFADFLAEDDIPPVKMDNHYDDDDDSEGFYNKAGGSTKAQMLFNESDWKFLLQFPPKYWRKALQWRYNEGLLKASETRELNGLDDESLPEHMDKIEFMDGTKKITILPLHGEKQVFTGFKELAKRIEDPVKMSSYREEDKPDPRCNDPEESKARIEARNQKLPPGPGIDQLNLYNSSHPDHAHLLPVDQYKGGKIGGDLTQPNKEDDKHPFAGWNTMDYIQSSQALMRWIKGSAFVNDKDKTEDPILPSRTQTVNGARVVKDPFTGEPVPVQMVSPRDLNAQWPSDIGQNDSVNYTHEDGTQVGGTAHKLEIPAIKKEICYKEKKASDVEEQKICQEVLLPVLNDGRIGPNFDKRHDYLEKEGLHLTEKQREALAKRRKKAVQSELDKLSAEFQLLDRRSKNSRQFPLNQAELDQLAKLEKEHARITKKLYAMSKKEDANPELASSLIADKATVDRLLNEPQGEKGSLLSRKPLEPKEYTRAVTLAHVDLRTGKELPKVGEEAPVLSKLDTSLQKEDPSWRSIGDVDNLFMIYDLLTPKQRQHLRNNQREQHHIAAWNNDPSFDSKWNNRPREREYIRQGKVPPFREYHDAQSGHYLFGGFSPMYHKTPSGSIPSNEERQNEIYKKYFLGGERSTSVYNPLPATSWRTKTDRATGETRAVQKKNSGNISIVDEAREGVEKKISLIEKQIGALSKRKMSGVGEDEVREKELTGILSALEYNREGIIEVAAALLMLQLNTPLMGVYDPELCLKFGLPNFPEQARKNRIDYAQRITSSIAQLSLKTASGARIPTRAEQKNIKRFKKDEGESTMKRGGDIAQRSGGISGERKTGFVNPDEDEDSDTLALAHWSAEGFKPLEKYFKKLHDQIKDLKGDAGARASQSIDKLEYSLENAITIWHKFFSNWLEKLTDEGMTGQAKEDLAMDKASKELAATLQAKFPEVAPEEINKLSNSVRQKSVSKAPEWLTDAFDDFIDIGIGTLELPNKGQMITFRAEDLAKVAKDVKTIRDVIYIAANKAQRALDDITNDYGKEGSDTTALGKMAAQDNTQKIDIFDLVNKYAVRMSEKVLPGKTRESIIKELVGMGYTPYEAKSAPEIPPKQEQPPTRQEPPAPPKVTAVEPPSKMAASSILGLLSDPINNWKEIINHPDATKYKPYIKAAVASLTADVVKKTEEAEKFGKEYSPSFREMVATMRLRDFSKS